MEPAWRKSSNVHAAVETLGSLLTLVVTPADEQDRAHVSRLAAAVQDVTVSPFECAFVDQGDTGDEPAQAAKTQEKSLGFKTIIRPGEKASKRQKMEINKRIRKLRGAPQEKLIKDLNPVIRGWANDDRPVVSSKGYHECDNSVYYQLVQWTKWRHPDYGVVRFQRMTFQQSGWCLRPDFSRRGEIQWLTILSPPKLWVLNASHHW